jgi:hypothetical protein
MGQRRRRAARGAGAGTDTAPDTAEPADRAGSHTPNGNLRKGDRCARSDQPCRFPPSYAVPEMDMLAGIFRGMAPIWRQRAALPASLPWHWSTTGSAQPSWAGSQPSQPPPSARRLQPRPPTNARSALSVATGTLGLKRNMGRLIAPSEEVRTVTGTSSCRSDSLNVLGNAHWGSGRCLREPNVPAPEGRVTASPALARLPRDTRVITRATVRLSARIACGAAGSVGCLIGHRP